MADIDLIYDSTNGIIDGKTSDGGHVSANQYNSLSAHSLEVINGHLDTQNRRRAPQTPFPGQPPEPLLWQAETVHLQPGAVSKAQSIGSSLNLDYFPEANFGDWNWGDATAGGGQGSTNDTKSLYQAIPGASIEFYLPHSNGVVLLDWKVTVSCFGDANSAVEWQDAAMRLFVNDAHTDLYHIIPMPDVHYGAGSKTHTPSIYDRVWSGHYTYQNTKGWQSASIRLAIGDGSSEIKHVRVRTRSFSYVYLH